MHADFVAAVETVIQIAPAPWLAAACDALWELPAGASVEAAVQRLPATHNSNLVHLTKQVLQMAAAGRMSWEALGWTLQTTALAYRRWQADHQLELLWAGPAPASQVPARRIDQALYDLVAGAQREIVLVTFAASRIQRLTDALFKAAQRGVLIRLILEFEDSSEGQLSRDAVRAFPVELAARAQIYEWPAEHRERNQYGKVGKLHAKVAVIDDKALVSSANLTDDAFTRNLEVGVMVYNPAFLETMRSYLGSLVESGILTRLE